MNKYSLFCFMQIGATFDNKKYINAFMKEKIEEQE